MDASQRVSGGRVQGRHARSFVIAPAAMVGLGFPKIGLGQDITGPVLLALPVFLLAPPLAFSAKLAVLRLRNATAIPTHRLVLLTLLEFLLWELLLPFGVVVAFGASDWGGPFAVAVEIPVFFFVGYLLNRVFLGGTVGTASKGQIHPAMMFLLSVLYPAFLAALIVAPYGFA